MQLELKDIKGGVLEQDYSCTLADFPELYDLAEQDGTQFKEPLEFHLRFQLTGQLVEVDGHVRATVELKCGRCLKSFEYLVAESFALTYTPQPDDRTDEDVELELEELGLVVYQDDILDLQGPLREQLIMAVPIRPVCHEGCLGLCPECGGDLNESQCHCVRKPFNNKFSVLADIELNKD